MSLLQRYSVAQEAIDYQGKSMLFKELTKIFEEYGLEKNKTLSTFVDTGIADVIRKHTGLHVVPFLSDEIGYNAHILLPAISINHPLMKTLQDSIKMAMSELNYDINSDYQKSLQHLGLLTKTIEVNVDTKNSRINGDIDKIPYDLHIGKQFFTSDKFTPPEIAAIVLHEIGHVFTYFEWLLKTAVTNCYLDDAWRRFNSTNSPEMRLRIVDATARTFNATDIDRESLRETSSKDYFYTVYLTSFLTNNRSNLGSNSVDYRVSEQVADQFAVRHGAGRDLVSGLAKLYRFSLHSSFMSTSTFVTMKAIQAALVLSLSLGFPIFGISFLVAYLASLALPDLDAALYDGPGQRSQKILNEITAALKNQKLSSQERSELLKDFELVKELTSKIKDRESLFMLIWRQLTPHRRDQNAQLKFQQELERLINNELFVKSQNLKAFL